MIKMEPIEYCVYYDQNSQKIIDFFPQNIDPELKNSVIKFWNQDIPQKILIELSMEEMNMQQLRKKIGHSNSTLHENIKKLQEAGLISSEIIYKGNKIRILKPRILFVSQSPTFKFSVKKFFQGTWVNSAQSKKVVSFLQNNPDKFFTPEEISAKTHIPVVDVQIVLDSWDSPITRAFSDLFKERPFEKKTLYKGRK